MTETQPEFFGAGYNAERDKARLTKSVRLVYEAMKDERWCTLRELSAKTGKPEASVSAHMRTLRTPKGGGYCILREHIEGGLYKYRLDHSLPSNYEPKGKPMDIVKLEAEHSHMRDHINRIMRTAEADFLDKEDLRKTVVNHCLIALNKKPKYG